MIEEVNVPSLKVGVDLPLFESQEPDFVRKTVRSMKELMVYSHSISIASKQTVGGVPFGWDEVLPGSEKDPCQWRVFLETCKEIGYDGYFRTSSAHRSSPGATRSRAWTRWTRATRPPSGT